MDYTKHTDNNLGIGPICRVKKKLNELQEKTSNLFANRSEYDWGMTPDGKVLYITDEGGLKSVTNDLENVLQDIQNTIPLRDMMNARIMYRDSMGIWDGISIRYTPGMAIQDLSFFPITEKEFNKACEKIMKLDFTPKN